MPTQLYQKGHIINDRWQINKKVGEGQFAEVYEIKDQHRQQEKYALKIDKKKDVKTVKGEIKVLQQLSTSCSQVCDVFQHGVYDGLHFMVMTLLGLNLFDLRRESGGKLTLQETSRVGQSTLKILKQIHNSGYVHRDVKPANFAIYPPQAGALYGHWYVIDFGLTRRFLDQDEKHQPIRDNCQFRGTSTYASINAHSKLDLSRRDDLWSWLYMLVELIEGDLPWRFGQEKERERTEITRDLVFVEKQNCIKQPSRLFKGSQMPQSIDAIIRHLDSLGFTDTPDYDFLDQQIQNLEVMVDIQDRQDQIDQLKQIDQIISDDVIGDQITNNDNDRQAATEAADIVQRGVGVVEPTQVNAADTNAQRSENVQQQSLIDEIKRDQNTENLQVTGSGTIAQYMKSSTYQQQEDQQGSQIQQQNGLNTNEINQNNEVVWPEKSQRTNTTQADKLNKERQDYHANQAKLQNQQQRQLSQQKTQGRSDTIKDSQSNINKQDTQNRSPKIQKQQSVSQQLNSPQYGKLMTLDEKQFNRNFKDKQQQLFQINNDNNNNINNKNSNNSINNNNNNSSLNGQIQQLQDDRQQAQQKQTQLDNNDLSKPNNMKRKLELESNQIAKQQKLDTVPQQPKQIVQKEQNQKIQVQQRQDLLESYTEFAFKGGLQQKAHEILKDIRLLNPLEAQGVILGIIKMLVFETNDQDSLKVMQMLQDISLFSNYYAKQAALKQNLVQLANNK